jgi:hypothetical protein
MFITGSRTGRHKPASKRQETIMKIALIFTRGRKPRRRKQTTTTEMLTNWTTRDWADMPVHHPRHD